MSKGKLREEEIRRIIRADDEWEPVGFPSVGHL